MRFHEEIYTSAPELLDSSTAGDLGVVARSKGFPSDVQRELELSRSYHIIDGIPLSDPKRHPPRWICALRGRERDYYCISRIVFAGADHTSRTTPLAHHLVFDCKLMRADEESPASLLTKADPCFVSEWQQSPKWFDPLRDLGSFNSSIEPEIFPSPAWKLLLGKSKSIKLLAAIAEQLLRFSVDRKPVVCLIEVEKAFLAAELMADLFRLLPKASQFEQVCASHVVSSADLPADTSLVFSYPDTPFVNDCAGRRDPRAPFVYDFTELGTTAIPTVGGYGSVVGNVLESTELLSRVDSPASLYERWGMSIESLDSFPHAWKLFHDLSRVTNSSELVPCTERLPKVTGISSTVADKFSDWCCEMVLNKQIKLFPEPECWDAFSMIFKEENWPQETRKRALKYIIAKEREALPRLLHGLDSSSSVDKPLQQLFTKRLEKSQDLISAFIDEAIAGNQYSKDAATWLIDVAPIQPENFSSWVNQLVSSIGRPAEFLQEPLTNYTLRAIGEIAKARQEVQVRACEAMLPSVQRLVEHTNFQDSNWEKLVQYYLRIVLKTKTPNIHLQWLAKTYPNDLTSERLHAWLDSFAGDGPRLRQLLVSSELLESEVIPVIEPAEQPDINGFDVNVNSPEIVTEPHLGFKKKRDDEYFGLSSFVRSPPDFVFVSLGFLSLLLYIVTVGIHWSSAELHFGWESTFLTKPLKILAAIIIVVLVSVIGVTILRFLLRTLLGSYLLVPSHKPVRVKRDEQDQSPEWIVASLLGIAVILFIVHIVSMVRHSATPNGEELMTLIVTVCLLWVANSIVLCYVTGPAIPSRLKKAGVARIIVILLFVFLAFSLVVQLILIAMRSGST